MNIAAAWVRTGRFSPTQAASSKKDLDIAEYTDPLHNPMIPHVIVLEPGLVIYKIYMGYWFWGRPTMEDLRQISASSPRNADQTGTSPRPK